MQLVEDTIRQTFIDNLDMTIDDIHPSQRSGIAYEHASGYWDSHCMVYQWNAAFLDLTTLSTWVINELLTAGLLNGYHQKDTVTNILNIYTQYLISPSFIMPTSEPIPERYRCNPYDYYCEKSKIFEHYKRMERIYDLECGLLNTLDDEVAEDVYNRNLAKLKYRSILNIYALLNDQHGADDLSRRFEASAAIDKNQIRQHLATSINDLRVFQVLRHNQNIENIYVANSFVKLLRSMFTDMELNAAQSKLSDLTLKRDLLGGLTIGITI